MQGIEETAEHAVNTAKRLLTLLARDKDLMQRNLGRAAGSAIRVHAAMRESPMGKVSKLTSQTGLSAPAATTALNNLERPGIVAEITGQSYGRVYAYNKYIAILAEGTEVPVNQGRRMRAGFGAGPDMAAAA